MHHQLPEIPLIPSEEINRSILLIRGYRVILDTDLAALFGVSTKRLNEQVKRNRLRFPVDFMFRLTSKEKSEVVANCDHLKRLKFSSTLPYVFTEHGTIMAANVLNSERAVKKASTLFGLLLDFGNYYPLTRSLLINLKN